VQKTIFRSIIVVVDSCEHVTAAPLAGEVDHYLDDGSYLSDEPGQ